MTGEKKFEEAQEIKRRINEIVHPFVKSEQVFLFGYALERTVNARLTKCDCHSNWLNSPISRLRLKAGLQDQSRTLKFASPTKTLNDVDHSR